MRSVILLAMLAACSDDAKPAPKPDAQIECIATDHCNCDNVCDTGEDMFSCARDCPAP